MSDKKNNEVRELTDEDKAAMPRYTEKWIKIGFNTDRLDPKRTEEIIHAYQREILERAETPVVIMPNPLEAWVACNYSVSGKRPDELQACVDNYYTKGKDIKIEQFIYPYQSGSFFAPIFSLYDFAFEQLKIDAPDDIKNKYKVWEATSELGLIFPLQDVCIVSEKPTDIHVRNNQLHCDGGPALAFESPDNRSEFKIYSLNDVRVDEYTAVTPSGRMDIQHFHKIKNADHKTEFVRKFGVERMLGLGKLIDSWKNYKDRPQYWEDSQYELHDMKSIYAGVNYAPHLKMVNQTTGVFHVEAVSPNCRNIRDALKERFGGEDLNILGVK